MNKLNIRTDYDDGRSTWFWLRANRIKIKIIGTYYSGETYNEETDDLYRVAFHELVYQSHYKLNRWRFSVGNNMIVESWATYIELIFIKSYYPSIYLDRLQKRDFGSYIWDKVGGKQKRPFHKTKWKYTTLFEDLADDENQLITQEEDRPNDNVKGYITTQMQEAVRKSRTLDQLKNELKKSNNGTKEHLDDLFDIYKRVEDTRKFN